MSTDPRVASAQYGDFKGTCSIDDTDHQGLHRLLQSMVEPGYWAIGFNCALKDLDARITVYAVELASLDEHPGSHFERIQKSIRARGGPLSVFLFSKTVPVADFFNATKRFYAAAFTRLVDLDGVEVRIVQDE